MDKEEIIEVSRNMVEVDSDTKMAITKFSTRVNICSNVEMTGEEEAKSFVKDHDLLMVYRSKDFKMKYELRSLKDFDKVLYGSQKDSWKDFGGHSNWGQKSLHCFKMSEEES